LVGKMLATERASASRAHAGPASAGAQNV